MKPVALYRDYTTQTGVDVLSIDQNMWPSITRMRNELQLPGKTAAGGTSIPLLLIEGGDNMRRAVARP